MNLSAIRMHEKILRLKALQAGLGSENYSNGTAASFERGSK
jgi:hypothetical protein